MSWRTKSDLQSFRLDNSTSLYDDSIKTPQTILKVFVNPKTSESTRKALTDQRFIRSRSQRCNKRARKPTIPYNYFILNKQRQKIRNIYNPSLFILLIMTDTVLSLNISSIMKQIFAQRHCKLLQTALRLAKPDMISAQNENLSGNVCKSGPLHFGSEKSFPSNFAL